MPIDAFSIPLSILLIPFAIFVALFVLYASFNVYHLLRFGIESHSLSVVIIFFLFGSVVLLGGVTFWLSTFQWGAELSPASIFRTTL